MSLTEELSDLYKRVGSRHILPFVGRAYAKPATTDLRVVAVGINAYLSEKDWKATEADANSGVHRWFSDFWKQVGVGKNRESTWPFYVDAYAEVVKLGDALSQSPLFAGRTFHGAPQEKASLYATNAIKAFLSQEYVDSTKVDLALLRQHAHTWHSELDLLAKHHAFPHVIVAFGEIIWESIWTAFHPSKAGPYEHLEIIEYTTAPDGSAIYHHANRVRVRTGNEEQTTLLLRVAHPSARGKAPRDAAWLLADGAFRELVGLH